MDRITRALPERTRTRLAETDVGSVRRGVQLIITGVLLLAGIQFFFWVAHFRYGTPYVPRPPSVEAFLPVSALVALKAWVTTGVYASVHPAGLTILLAVLLTAVVFHRGVCGWACPVGLVEEYLGDLGTGMLGRTIEPPWYLDWPLRSIKYLLLALFVKLILVDMSGTAARAFLQTPYNAVADVKMLDLWLSPGPVTLGLMAVLVAGSLVVRNAWCRYLCPYGALLSVIGLLSPATANVSRDEAACVDCGLCTAACPNYVDVQHAETVTALECTRCSQCVNTCPKGALEFRAGPVSLTPTQVGLGVVGIVLLVVLVAMATGNWHSSIGYDQWARLVPAADRIGHAPY